MPNLATELVLLRNEFYMRSYAQIKQIVLILILICILLIGLCKHQQSVIRPAPKYFPTTPDGRMIYSPPYGENHLLLSKQVINPDTGIIVGMPQPTRLFTSLEPEGENALVLYWAYVAALDMFNYDFVHYRSVIQDASKYFTPQGHQNFIDALVASKNLETVKVRNAIVIPEVNGPVKLLRTGMADGHYVWHLKVPIKLTYASAKDIQPLVQQLSANMSIGRVSTLISPFYGLSIYRLNFEEVISTR